MNQKLFGDFDYNFFGNYSARFEFVQLFSNFVFSFVHICKLIRCSLINCFGYHLFSFPVRSYVPDLVWLDKSIYEKKLLWTQHSEQLKLSNYTYAYKTRPWPTRLNFPKQHGLRIKYPKVGTLYIWLYRNTNLAQKTAGRKLEQSCHLFTNKPEFWIFTN